MSDANPTVVTESYDLNMNLNGLYCSYNTGEDLQDQMEYACLFQPGLHELGAWPEGLAPLYAKLPLFPPVGFTVNHDFRAYKPTWAQFAQWAVQTLVESTPNSRESILANVVWGQGLWQAKNRDDDAASLIENERSLDGEKLNRSSYLSRIRFGPPIAGTYAEAPTSAQLPYKQRLFQMKGDANTQPALGFVYYGNNWKPQTLADFLGEGSPESWQLLQVADWQVQRESPGFIRDSVPLGDQFNE
jgi:hypothetical protein